MYGMYTDAGGEAVSSAISQVLEEYGPPQTEDSVYDYIRKINKIVVAMGEGQVNNSEYSDDPIEGFYEVSDTAVREQINEVLMDEMETALANKP